MHNLSKILRGLHRIWTRQLLSVMHDLLSQVIGRSSHLQCPTPLILRKSLLPVFLSLGSPILDRVPDLRKQRITVEVATIIALLHAPTSPTATPPPPSPSRSAMTRTPAGPSRDPSAHSRRPSEVTRGTRRLSCRPFAR